MSIADVFGIKSVEDGEAILRKAGIPKEGEFQIPHLLKKILENEDLEMNEKCFIIFNLGGFEATMHMTDLMNQAMQEMG